MNPSLKTLVLAAGLVAGIWCSAGAAAEEADAMPAERVAVGMEAPAIVLPDTTGAEHRSAQLRGEKNLVVVFFRGAW